VTIFLRSSGTWPMIPWVCARRPDLVALPQTEKMSPDPFVPPSMARARSLADPPLHGSCLLSLLRTATRFRTFVVADSRLATGTR
jgi:hypothetical protein